MFDDAIAAPGAPLATWSGDLNPALFKRFAGHDYLSTCARRRIADLRPRPPTEEEVRLYGQDATLAMAIIRDWQRLAFVLNGAEADGTSLSILYLMDMDLHTLPPLPAACKRLSLARLPRLQEVPAEFLARTDMLYIHDCPVLAPPVLPERGHYSLQISLGKKDFVQASIRFDCGGRPRPGERAYEICVERVRAYNQQALVTQRMKWWRENKEELVMEAWKPERVGARLEKYGYAALELQHCEGVGRRQSI